MSLYKEKKQEALEEYLSTNRQDDSHVDGFEAGYEAAAAIYNIYPFTCPECTGHYFGSRFENLREPNEVHYIRCHDQHHIGCKFEGLYADVIDSMIQE